MYEYIIKLANKKNVLAYLYGLSFIESFIFPIPPDAMIAPMVIAKKENHFKIFLIATIDISNCHY